MSRRASLSLLFAQDMTKIGAGARLAHSYIRFVLNNESQGTSLARRKQEKESEEEGVVGKVSRRVAPHLTSMLITPFYQRN